MVAVLALLAVFVVATAYVSRKGNPELREAASASFAAASAAEQSGVNRVLLGMARPLSGLPLVHLEPESPTYKALRTKLAAAGNMYNGSVVVFVSASIFNAFLAAMAFVALIAADAQGVILFAGAIGGLALTAYPYNRVSDAAKKREAAVRKGLPEFAELLLMPLSSGQGILSALNFTATRVHGPVSDEVKTLLEVLSSRSRDEAGAFADCADRLGTPAAQSFFTALSQAYIEGVRVVDNLRGQAEQLRKADYERMREKLKKMPNKLAILIGLHLIPTLFIIVMFPTFTTLSAI